MANSVSSTAAQERSPASELMDVEQFAELLNCSTRTVRRMADSGACPRPVKILSLVRWRRSEVVEWLDNGCPSCRGARR